MSLLDKTAYDLTTPEGQQDAIRDIIDEHNRQYDVAGQTFAGLNVAAYGSVDITLNVPSYSGAAIPVVSHVLGYEPIFIAYFGKLSSAGIFPVPVVDFIGAVAPNFGGAVNFYVDKTNLYLKWDDTAPAPIQTITYIIFANPIVSS